jgi:hypothetical protein
MQPRDKILLAVKLAASLLQLNFTQWLPVCWTRAGIYFFCKPGTETGTRNPDFNCPLLIQEFDADRNSVPMSPSIDPTVALFELGVMLLEIWTSKAFVTSDWSQEQSASNNTYEARFHPLLRWFDHVKNELLTEYRTVVIHCIKYLFDDHDKSWRNAKLREAMCAAIIAPLETLCT